MLWSVGWHTREHAAAIWPQTLSEACGTLVYYG